MKRVEFYCPECGQKIVARLKGGEILECLHCGAAASVPRVETEIERTLIRLEAAASAGELVKELERKAVIATAPSTLGTIPVAEINTVGDVWQLLLLLHFENSPMLEDRLSQIAKCNPNLLLDFLSQDWQALHSAIYFRRERWSLPSLVGVPLSSFEIKSLGHVQSAVLKAVPKERSPKFVETMVHLMRSGGETPAVCHEARAAAAAALVDLGDYAALDTLKQSSNKEVKFYIRRALMKKDGFPPDVVGRIIGTLCSGAKVLPESTTKWMELCLQDNTYFEDLLRRTRHRQTKLLDGLSNLNSSVSKQLLGRLANDFISGARFLIIVGVLFTALGILGGIWCLWSETVGLARPGWWAFATVLLLPLGIVFVLSSVLNLRRGKKYLAHPSDSKTI
jgi:hypothetical protein